MRAQRSGCESGDASGLCKNAAAGVWKTLFHLGFWAAIKPLLPPERATLKGRRPHSDERFRPTVPRGNGEETRKALRMAELAFELRVRSNSRSRHSA
jgi:hypothetical protein